MPTIISGLGLTMAAAGLLYPARAIGSLIGASVGGLFCDRAGGKTLLTGSAGLLMIGLAGAAGAPHWSQFLVAFFLAGIAQGALTTGINAVTAEASGQQGARALNQLHGVYSVGAALSPVVVGWFINSGAGWRSVLWYLAAIWLTFTCVSWLTKYPCEVSGTAKKATSLGLLFRHPVLLFAGAVAFSYNGVAWSLIGWINTYMQRDAGLPAFLSAGMITVFYTALAGGRFACASLAARYGNDKILLVCALGSALSYPLVLIQHWPLVAVLGTLGSGLFLSGLYPTALACAARFSPDPIKV
jgi:fucose permease